MPINIFNDRILLLMFSDLPCVTAQPLPPLSGRIATPGKKSHLRLISIISEMGYNHTICVCASHLAFEL